MQVFNLIMDKEVEFADLTEEQRDDEDIILEAIKYANEGDVLEYASDRLKDNEDVVLAAIKKNGWALGDASERLRNNKDFVLEAVKQNGNALYYTSERLQNDKELLEILKGVNICYISIYLKKWYEERMEFLANLRKADAMENSISSNNKIVKKKL